MDASIETKATALEEVIEKQKQLNKMKENLNIYNAHATSFCLDSFDDFVAYADYFKEQKSFVERAMESANGTHPYIYASFYHLEIEIYAYPRDEEMEKYFGKEKVKRDD